MARKLSGFEPAGKSGTGSYAGEILQYTIEAKNDKSIEGRMS